MVSSKKIIRALEKDGWLLVSVRGDHHKFKHSTKKGIVTVPHPESDVAIGTLQAIEKQSGLQLRIRNQKKKPRK